MWLILGSEMFLCITKVLDSSAICQFYRRVQEFFFILFFVFLIYSILNQPQNVNGCNWIRCRFYKRQSYISPHLVLFRGVVGYYIEALSFEKK